MKRSYRTVPLAFLLGAVVSEKVSAQVPPLVPAGWSVTSSQSGEELGIVAGLAGDVDGDGYADALVGAPDRDAGALAGAGWIALYRGGPLGLSTAPLWTFAGTNSAAHVGNTFTAAPGDVTGDGIPDLLLGSGSRIELWSGNASGFTATGWFRTATVFSTAHTTHGDVNGDGVDDLLFTSTNGSGFGSSASINLYFGGQAVPAAAPDWSLQALAGFGFAVEHAGDVNGDGYGDILFSAVQGTPFATPGLAYLWLGTAGVPVDSGWSASGAQANEMFGDALAGVGDVNGDGFDDVVVGATGWNGGNNGYGRASLFLGSSTGLATTPAWTYAGTAAGQWMGAAVAPAGDVDGDGYADFFVYSRAFLGGPGRVHLFLGGPEGPACVPDWQDQAPSAGGYWPRFGRPGDIDGDGLSDQVLGDADGIGGTALAFRAQAPTLSFCAGDGSGSACPCGNVGALGHGCENSFTTGGGLLSAAGSARVSADTLVLSTSALPPTAPCLYFQGTTRVNCGAGVAFGDGLRCAGGAVVRLAQRASAGGASSYPVAGDVPLSVRGAIPAAGGSRTYQVWYRNSAPFCTSATSNTTNGLRVTWRP